MSQFHARVKEFNWREVTRPSSPRAISKAILAGVGRVWERVYDPHSWLSFIPITVSHLAPLSRSPGNLQKESFYGLCLRSVAHSLTCCFSENVPLLHTSRYVIPRDPVLPGLPPVSNASDKHWGEKAWVRGYFNRPPADFAIHYTYRDSLNTPVLKPYE